MRKKHLFIPVLIILGLGVFYYLSAPSKPKSKKKVLAVSSEDLIQQQINKKIERRKNGYSKPADKPDKYVEYKNAMVSGFGKAKYPKNYKVTELKSAYALKSSLKSTTVDLAWVQRGPGNVGGRTRAIIIDHSDPTQQTWFAGAVAGGIWKTTDSGTNWQLISPNLPNLSISTLAMAESNSNVIYAGTGEGYFNFDAIQGNGIYKSVNNGVTWNQIPKTTNTSYFHYINSIVVSTTDENTLFVSTNKIVAKSVDGGSNWSNITPKQGGEGRYQRLIMHPTNENILWVALNDNGIYKTTNAGESWFQVLDLSGESRIELAVSPSNPDVLYALNQNSKLYYSINGGDDWAECVDAASTDFLGGQGWYNNVIKVDPTNANKGFIGGVDFYGFTLGEDVSGTSKNAYNVVNGMSSVMELGNFYGNHANGGLEIYEGYDSSLDDVEIQFGTTISQKAHRLTTTSYTQDINEDISSLTYMDYVDVPFKVIRTHGLVSEQLYASFIDSNNNGIFDLTADGYEVIVVHDILYDETQANTLITTNNGNSKLLFSIYPQLVDGVTWDKSSLPSGNIVVDPFSLKNKSLTAEHLSVWHSPTASNYSHADHHSINILEGVGSPFAIIVGNDGGIFYSNDGGSKWVTKSKGYITTQFYGISRHPSEYKYFGGMQDNGSYISGTNPSVSDDWTAALSGDGFDAVWHSRDPQKLIGSVYNNDLAKSEDGGVSWIDISGGFDDNTPETAPFLTKIASSTINPDLLFIGGASGLWKSEDFGTSWENINMGTNWGWGDGGYPKIAISEANPDVVWAGIIMNSSAGYTKGTMHVSTDGGQSFSNAVNAMDLGAVSNIATHPSDPNTAYLLFSYAYYPKVFRTTDLGQTWEDITGFNQVDGEGNVTYGADFSSNGFPNVAVNSLLVMPFDENEIWVGTEIGLFISYDNGATWAIADNGIPAVSIWDMKIVGDEVIVGTHGLGVWTVKRNGLSSTNYYPYINGIGVNPKGNYNIELNYDVAYDKVEIYADDVLLNTYNNTVVGLKQYEIDATGVEGKNRVRVLGYVGEEAYSSNGVDIPVNNLLNVVSSYSNTFTTQLGDFYGNGFSVNSIDLDNNAITTQHPYQENKDIFYTLKYPVVVSTDHSMAFLKYIDIAYIETGEAGSVYPQSDFYDYVVVEASTDGINWVALADGYDYNYSDVWTTGSTSYSDTPTSDQYIEHVIDLWDIFNAEDTIIIRLKLHSDQLEAGWGWAIDNLQIQEEVSGIFDQSSSDFNFEIYPNPVSDQFSFAVEDDYIGKVKINVYSVSGELVKTQEIFKDSPYLKGKMNVESYPSGSYIVAIVMGDKKSTELMIVK